MIQRLLAFCAGCLVLFQATGASPSTNAPKGMVWVPEGIYRPLFRAESDPKETRIPGFWVEACPVTESQYLTFVRSHSQWQRSKVKALFADAGYLRHWISDLDPGTNQPGWAQRPVVNVSWFAAKSYAAAQGRRLPTTAEWEMVAAAGYQGSTGSSEPEFQEALLRWYATPTPVQLSRVGSMRPNYYGIYDLHGLIWEWTSDFNMALGTGDARNDTGLERQLFCGAGSLGATDRANYPGYMREGLRSSLKAPYCVHNLGFRCALNP